MAEKDWKEIKEETRNFKLTKPGDSGTVVLIGKPFEFWSEYVRSAGRSLRYATKDNDDCKLRYAVNAYDVDRHKIQVIEGGVRLMKQLRNILEKLPYDNVLINITRTGDEFNPYQAIPMGRYDQELPTVGFDLAALYKPTSQDVIEKVKGINSPSEIEVA